MDVQSDPIAAKKLSAYVPDQPFLYDKLSGIEFMNFIADLYGLAGADRLKEIDRLIELFGMNHENSHPQRAELAMQVKTTRPGFVNDKYPVSQLNLFLHEGQECGWRQPLRRLR